jgi:hypothetical protein
MTFREFQVYFEQQMKHKQDELKVHERFAARICSMIANANRDSKKKPSPFKEDDFIAKERKPMTREQLKVMLKAITIAHGGEIRG